MEQFHPQWEEDVVPEQERQVVASIECIAPQGLGFGDGSISTTERARDDEDFPDKLAFIGDKILNDSETFKLVEADDDGCGDGRGVLRVFSGISPMGSVKSYHSSDRCVAQKYSLAERLPARACGERLVASRRLARRYRVT